MKKYLLYGSGALLLLLLALILNIHQDNSMQTPKNETWKEYRNEPYGFSLSYPSDMTPAPSGTFGGEKIIARFSNNKPNDRTEIFVSDIHNFPIDSYAGTVEDGGLSVKLKSFDEFTTHEAGRGIKENIGGLNTFRIRGFSGYQPTLYIDTGNNTYIYITISSQGLSPDHEEIFKSLVSTTKNKI